MKQLYLSVILLSLWWSHASANPTSITINIPKITDAPVVTDFYTDLLQKAFHEINIDASINLHEVSHQRAILMLEQGGLSAYWLVRNAQRDTRFRVVPIGLTNGMIGKRILLIRPEDQALYNNVSSLDDFRQLNQTAAMGKNWFDTHVWKHNQLAYKEKAGSWTPIYKMIALSRDFDYFPRGMNEVLIEAQQHPYLSVEERLVLIYNRDFVFYLPKHGKHNALIEKAIYQAKSSGLLDELFTKYWAPTFSEVGYENRVQIKLDTPPL